MVITPYSPEVENITAAIQGQSNHIIAITSSNEGEGVSTIAHSVTQRLLLSGHSVLLVDLNSEHPAISNIMQGIKSTGALPTPELVTPVDNESVFTGLIVQENKATEASLRKPNVLKNNLSQWHNEYDYIIVDCPSILNKGHSMLPAEQIAEACGALILVTLSRRTTEASLVQALRRINRERVNIIGIVINDRLNPVLKEELQRQFSKAKRFLPSCLKSRVDSINSKIERTPFFSMDI